ncbi:hypothetical protein L1049_026178 [Liquidambar formosana]|uniref:ER membrane protein complex subunit 6 n=1 Tax=Liquidambar formosana TaxID=63359 RepID=A0AAP0NE85_LIQFO
MAGHGHSGASVKKSSEAANDIPTFNAEKLQRNMKVVYYSRTFLSIIGGVIAGILGLTGLSGFILYFLIMAVTSVGLTAKAGFSIHSYFDGWNRVLHDGFLGGLLVCIASLLFVKFIIYLLLFLVKFFLHIYPGFTSFCIFTLFEIILL